MYRFTTIKLVRWVHYEIALLAILIILFIYTGGTKILNFQEFNSNLKSQPIPSEAVLLLAILLPTFEISVAILLLVRKSTLLALWFSLLTGLIYFVYSLMVVTNYFDRVPCSCVGWFKSFTWNQQLLFSFFFLVITCLGIFSKLITRGSRKPDLE